MSGGDMVTRWLQTVFRSTADHVLSALGNPQLAHRERLPCWHSHPGPASLHPPRYCPPEPERLCCLGRWLTPRTP